MSRARKRLMKLFSGKEKKVNKFPQTGPGLLVTAELDDAIARCKAEVERIARDCRAKNRKFRDLEFDLENDKTRTLSAISPDDDEIFFPADVHRVTQIFSKPQFFSHSAANASDIKQGMLGDCWFLSALSTVSTAPGLIEKICVARDEKVGVYGFIFFRDNFWVTVIIDDLLFTSVPKWEELRSEEQELYHNSKDSYNATARKGGASLFFAKSGTAGETWVPLIEKAYAKLHGNFAYLSGGRTCEGIEDLTGGVSTIILSNDILDVDRFWEEELTRANKDRLFGCCFMGLSSVRSGVEGATVQGLIGSHAYSVLRAVEVNGKRFVVVRNPWGQSEWTGRWSDGSKEWTSEWLQYLEVLGHQFGDDGQFVMEYSDWLECFSQIDRTRLFDDEWVMSSQYLAVKCPPLPAAWSFGDVCFKLSISDPTTAVIVLSQLDERYFRDLAGAVSWNIDFCIVKDGENEHIADSARSVFYQRSVHLEVELEAGDYTVYVRLDRSLGESDGDDTVSPSQMRMLSRILTERAKSRLIAENVTYESEKANMPYTVSRLIELENAVSEWADNEEEEEEEEKSTKKKAATASKDTGKKGKGGKSNTKSSNSSSAAVLRDSGANNGADDDDDDDGDGDYVPPWLQAAMANPSGGDDDSGESGELKIPYDSPNEIVIGLKVYTSKEVSCSIAGLLSQVQSVGEDGEDDENEDDGDEDENDEDE
ncbi:hypothetical protein BXZ70DRAFT_220215 [Cristinia sonorae]|uniref:Calpain catalytic domain-containing protein n=1 Tax=Cristinia sonorae TaxID=1940300 RepID=A0A8K0XPD6_9AGAR|nr:hypothetical protein BXZ70DRAFT_220215 [Cristinia sonorae]